MSVNIIKVVVAEQSMYHYQDDQLIRQYPVSTAALGVGEQYASYQTPRGWHQIRAKIGNDNAIDTVYKARRPVGLYADMVATKDQQDDWIMTRILWLSGLQPGFNRFGSVDSMRRYIYIHGSPEEVDGQPRSSGCIRMKCEHMLALFDQVSVGDRVLIVDSYESGVNHG